jgi:type VI secretion system protein ImpK
MTAAAETAPSLAVEASTVPTLRDLLEEGIYLLFLLRDGNAPKSGVEFNRCIDRFLAQYDKQARSFGKSADRIEHAKYAFCALLDEIVLSSEFPLRDEWERTPLQLRLFGEHLAGEGFFERLEMLRADLARNIEVLEVFHTCLLLGFQGKYLLEGKEKLGYLILRVGQDIQQIRGSKADFAPNWKLPRRFQSFVRNEMPMWFYFALLSTVVAALFGIYKVLLESKAIHFFGM